MYYPLPNSRGCKLKFWGKTPLFQLLSIKTKRPLPKSMKFEKKYHIPSLPNYSTPPAIRQGRVSPILGKAFVMKWKIKQNWTGPDICFLRIFWQLVLDFVFMEERLRSSIFLQSTFLIKVLIQSLRQIVRQLIHKIGFTTY